MDKTITIKGKGFLEIDENNQVLVYMENSDEPINLVDILSKYNGHEIHFSFVTNEAI